MYAWETFRDDTRTFTERKWTIRNTGLPRSTLKDPFAPYYLKRILFWQIYKIQRLWKFPFCNLVESHSSFRPPIAWEGWKMRDPGKEVLSGQKECCQVEYLKPSFFRLQWKHFAQDLWLCIYMFAAWGMWQSSIKVALEVKLTIKLGKYDWTPLWALPNTRAISQKPEVCLRSKKKKTVYFFTQNYGHFLKKKLSEY